MKLISRSFAMVIKLTHCVVYGLPHKVWNNIEKVFVILCALLVAALIMLKITARKSEQTAQANQEPQPKETRRTVPRRRLQMSLASVGSSGRQTQNEECNELDV